METPISESSSGRQLIICCDGTNNNLTGRLQDTNVVKVIQLLSLNSDAYKQLVFYDPGVGNPGELPGVTILDKIRRYAERLGGLAFGSGVYENMAQCYSFLMKHYQTGDDIYIFGFSRGAFTARSLAGLINQFGILRPHMESLVPTLLHIYFSDRTEEDSKRQMVAIAEQTSHLFAAADSRHVDIQFVGVWDTVASVGLWPFQARITAKPTIVNKRFVHVRQALALDEHRAQFKPRLYVDNNGSYQTAGGKEATIKQLWFRGSHCNVGGGYKQGDTAVSDQALRWILSEAVQCGLRLTHDGQSLETESGVGVALSAHYPPSPTLKIQSELRNTCLWALTGMAVRDTTQVILDDDVATPVTPVEHPSVARDEPIFPAATAWVEKRSRKRLIYCLLAMPVVWLVLGHLLTVQTFSGHMLEDLHQMAGRLGSYAQHNVLFARWQLLWWMERPFFSHVLEFDSPRVALLWDFVFIGLYAYVLAWFSVHAFARHARLRRAGDGIPKYLNRLGWALPLAVFFDIAENLITWLVLTLAILDMTVVASLLAVLMTLLSVMKYVALSGVVWLCIAPPAKK